MVHAFHLQGKAELSGTSMCASTVALHTNAQPADRRIQLSKIPQIRHGRQLQRPGIMQPHSCPCRALPADQLSAALNVFYGGINGVCFNAECAADCILLAVLAVPLVGLLAIIHTLRPKGYPKVRLLSSHQAESFNCIAH